MFDFAVPVAAASGRGSVAAQQPAETFGLDDSAGVRFTLPKLLLQDAVLLDQVEAGVGRFRVNPATAERVDGVHGDWQGIGNGEIVSPSRPARSSSRTARPRRCVGAEFAQVRTDGRNRGHGAGVATNGQADASRRGIVVFDFLRIPGSSIDEAASARTLLRSSS